MVNEWGTSIVEIEVKENSPRNGNYFRMAFINDVQLGVFTNLLGIGLFLLIILYHYVIVADPAKLSKPKKS